MPIHFRERLASYIEPQGVIRYGIWSVYVTIRDAFRSQGIKAIMGAPNWHDEAFHRWYHASNEFFIRYERTTNLPDLIALAEGTVLELGPGLGNQIPSFDQSKIDHIYGVEINGNFMPDLQAKVAECGVDDKYTVIHASVGDSDVLDKHGIKPGTIDTIVSVQVFCSAAKPEAVAKEMYQLLKPGGKLIFWEHHQSHDFATRIAQHLWNPVWSFLVGGCSLNRDIFRYITSAGAWKNVETIKGDEQNKPWGMKPRIWGVLVKA